MEDSLRTDKATRILMLYHQLLGGHIVDKFTYSLEHGVNERTFDRDIETIRSFLSDVYSGNQVLFDRENNTYYLSGVRPKYMERMAATVFAKILLESRVLRSDEMQGLIHILLSLVKPYDAEVIKNYISQDMRLYRSESMKAILKFIEDLYGVIKAGSDVELILSSSVECKEVLNVSPLQIMCENNKLCLLAARDFKLNKIMTIPIESIISFRILRTNFAEGLKEKYEEMGKEQNGHKRNS